MKSHKLGRPECWSQVAEHYQGLNFSFLDKGEFDGEPSKGVATLPIPTKIFLDVLAPASEATTTKPVTAKPSIIHETAPADPAIMAGPFVAVNPKEAKNRSL